jgi:hypothetical protein
MKTRHIFFKFKNKIKGDPIQKHLNDAGRVIATCMAAGPDYWQRAGDRIGKPPEGATISVRGTEVYIQTGADGNCD